MIGSTSTRGRGRSLVLVAAAVLTASGLVACGSGSSSSGSSGGAGSGGGTLVIDSSFDLKTVDPGREYELTGQMLTKGMYETLLTFANNDLTKPVGDLASSYVLSPDAKTLTLTLAQGRVFSDGTPITADDVVFSLQRLIGMKGNPSFLLDGVTVSQEGRHHGRADQRDAQSGPAVHPAQPGAVGRQLKGRHGQRRHHRREGRGREVPQRRLRRVRPVRAEVARRGQPGRAHEEPEVQRSGQARLRHRRHPQRQSGHPGAQRPEGRLPGRAGPLRGPGQEPEHGQGHRHQRAVRLHDLPAAQPGCRGLARHQQPPVRLGREEGHRLRRAAGRGR